MVNDRPVEELEGFLVEEQAVEEDREANQFSSIKSSLSWQQLEKQKEDFNIACRYMVRSSDGTKHFFFCVQDQHWGNDVRAWLGSGAWGDNQFHQHVGALWVKGHHLSTFLNISFSDPPEQARITQEEDAIKNQSVELICELDDSGNPEVEEFIWTK